MSASRTLAILTLILNLCHPALGQPPAHAPGGAGRAVVGTACTQASGATQSAAATQAQRELARLLLSTMALTHRYEELQQRGDTIPLQLDAIGRAIREAVRNRLDISSAAFAGFGLSSAALTVMWSVNEGTTSSNPFQRIGWLGIGSASGVILSNHSIERYQHSLLPGHTELSIAGQDEIRRNLDQDLSEPVRQLAEVLGWNAAQSAHFSRSLQAKVIAAFVRSTRAATHDSPFVQEVVANLGNIDFLDILKDERLARPDQLQALQELRAISLIFKDLRDGGNETLTEFGHRIRRQGPVESKLSALRGLRAGLATVSRNLAAASPALAAATVQIKEIDDAIATIQTYCELEK